MASLWEELFGRTPQPTMDEFTTERALTNAMRNSMKMYYQVEAGKEVGGGIMDRIFPSQTEKKNQELQDLEIIERRKRLGLPFETDQYEEMLNENKTVHDPGRALMWTGMALSKKPLLKFGASPLFKGEKHGSSVIERIFG